MAGKVVFFLCYLLVQVSNTAGFLLLEVNPPDILSSLTQLLTVNCSYSNTEVTNISSINSLVLSKSDTGDSNSSSNNNNNNQKQFVDLAILNISSSDQVTELSQIEGIVSGLTGKNNQSSLSITWSYPTAKQSGQYRCEIEGTDDTGNQQRQSQTALVTSSVPSVEQFLNKFDQLQNELAQREDFLKNQSNAIDNLLSVAKNRSETISSHQSRLDLAQALAKNQSDAVSNSQRQFDLVESFVKDFEMSRRYQDHYYLLSKQGWSNSARVEETCNSLGGYTAKIEDSDEHFFIQQFLDDFAGYNYVLVSGTDEGHEGNWTYTSTDDPLVYTDWSEGEPSQPQENCIVLYRPYLWQMIDFFCNYSFERTRFLCEVNID